MNCDIHFFFEKKRFRRIINQIDYRKRIENYITIKQFIMILLDFPHFFKSVRRDLKFRAVFLINISVSNHSKRKYHLFFY